MASATKLCSTPLVSIVPRTAIVAMVIFAKRTPALVRAPPPHPPSGHLLPLGGERRDEGVRAAMNIRFVNRPKRQVSSLLRLFTRAPEHTVAHELDVSLVIVRITIVAKRQPHHATLRMFNREHHRIRLALLLRLRRGQHFDRRALRVGLEPIELILETEF